jgi:MFS family permease
MPIGPYAGKLSDRCDPRRLCTIAMLLAATACVVFAVSIPLPGLTPVVVYLILLAVAYALFFPANNNLVMTLAPSENQGAASAIYTNVMNVGMVLGVCLFEGMFSHSLPAGLSLRDLPAGADSENLTAVSAAFQSAFLVGAFFSIAAFVASFISGRLAAGGRR